MCKCVIAEYINEEIQEALPIMLRGIPYQMDVYRALAEVVQIIPQGFFLERFTVFYEIEIEI